MDPQAAKDNSENTQGVASRLLGSGAAIGVAGLVAGSFGVTGAALLTNIADANILKGLPNVLVGLPMMYVGMGMGAAVMKSAAEHASGMGEQVWERLAETRVGQLIMDINEKGLGLAAVAVTGLAGVVAHGAADLDGIAKELVAMAVVGIGASAWYGASRGLQDSEANAKRMAERLQQRKEGRAEAMVEPNSLPVVGTPRHGM